MRNLYPQHAINHLPTWNGDKLRKGAIDMLVTGSIVRVVVDNDKTNTSEALYFEIIKIKDGTFWGLTQHIYRTPSFCNVGLENSQVFTFRRQHIVEIPISWQPRRIQRRLAQFIV